MASNSEGGLEHLFPSARPPPSGTRVAKGKEKEPPAPEEQEEEEEQQQQQQQQRDEPEPTTGGGGAARMTSGGYAHPDMPDEPDDYSNFGAYEQDARNATLEIAGDIREARHMLSVYAAEPHEMRNTIDNWLSQVRLLPPALRLAWPRFKAVNLSPLPPSLHI